MHCIWKAGLVILMTNPYYIKYQPHSQQSDFQLKFIGNFSLNAEAEKAALLSRVFAKRPLCSLPISDPENPLTPSNKGKKSAL